MTFQVNAAPAVKKRPRVTQGGAYTPRVTSSWEKLVAQHAWLEMRRLKLTTLDGPVALALTFGLARAAGDLDNYIKAVCDALNGVVYRDDRQVVALTACKLKRANAPFARITVTRLPEGWGAAQEESQEDGQQDP